MIQRRGFLASALAALAAPSIITRPGILMPVRTPLIVRAKLTPVDLYAISVYKQGDQASHGFTMLSTVKHEVGDTLYFGGEYFCVVATS